MPHFGRTLRRALDLRIGLVAFAALSALAFAARDGKIGPWTAELCRLSRPWLHCGMSSPGSETADLHQQRDLWLNEEAVFEQERAAFEARDPVSQDFAATQSSPGDSTAQSASNLRLPAGPDAEEDAVLRLTPHDSLALALQVATLREVHAPATPAAPGPILAAAAPFVASGPAGVGVFPPSERVLIRRHVVLNRYAVAPIATTVPIFRSGYFSIRNGYAGRDAATFHSVPPARLSRFVRAPHPAPLFVIVPTTVQTSPEFRV